MFYEEFSISKKEKQIQREAYNLWDVCGDVGGISQVVATIAMAMILPFSRIDFEIEAIKKLLNFSELHPELKDPSNLQKICYVTGICAKK